jgi:hypothetical protein
MWGAVLTLALVTTADPVRIGIAVLLFSRTRPAVHLLALWLGGMAAGVAMAVGVLFGVRGLVPGPVEGVHRAATSSTAGHIQIAIGVLALGVAASVAAGLPSRRRARSAVPGGRSPGQPEPAKSSRLLARALNALRSGPPWTTFVVGVVISTDFRYLAALSAILASGVVVGAQVGAAALYTIVALAFVEIPLVARLAVPAKTHAVMSDIHDWVSAHRRGVFGAVVALLGVFLVAAGMSHI